MGNFRTRSLKYNLMNDNIFGIGVASIMKRNKYFLCDKFYHLTDNKSD